MCPLPWGLDTRLCGIEVDHRAIFIEDFQDESKHHPFGLGNRDGLGAKCQGTLHQEGVALWLKLDPVDRASSGPLSSGNLRNQPVPGEEPAASKAVVDVKNQGFSI
jgi:hypothetical protein